MLLLFPTANGGRLAKTLAFGFVQTRRAEAVVCVFDEFSECGPLLVFITRIITCGPSESRSNNSPLHVVLGLTVPAER